MTPKKQFIIFLTFVVGFVLILMLAFGRRPSSNTANPNTKKTFTINDYAERDSKVVATFDGPINGDDAHRSIKISVSQESRTIDVIQGYEGKVIKTQTFTNNPDAYYDFIHALARVSFGRTRKTDTQNEVGVCATGRRFVYEAYDNNERVARTWAATCNKGNSLATFESVNNLFRMQITDYDKVVSGVKY